MSLFARARYYDPVTARFTQEDTYRGDVMDVRSLNLYAYCYNDPVNYVDPSGHDAESNINSAFNAWRGGYITYEQYAENVRLNGGVPVSSSWQPPPKEEWHDPVSLMPPSTPEETLGSYKPEDNVVINSNGTPIGINAEGTGNVIDRSDAASSVTNNKNWSSKQWVVGEGYSTSSFDVIVSEVYADEQYGINSLYDLYLLYNNGEIDEEEREQLLEQMIAKGISLELVASYVESRSANIRFVNSQGSLNMRTGPGTGNAVITSIESGAEVIFTGNKTSKMIDGHYWAEVTYNGTTGWVAATYLAYEHPDTREAWVAVGTHDIVTFGINLAAHHSATIIFADPNSQLVKDNSSLFVNSTEINGVSWKYGTLGAASDNGGPGGNLKAASNRASDVAIIKDTVTGAEWQSVYASYQSILSLIDLNNNYIKYHNGGVAYSATPWPDENKWNSNSYTYSLLTYAGIIPPSFSDSIYGGYPGWNQLVPRNMFD